MPQQDRPGGDFPSLALSESTDLRYTLWGKNLVSRDWHTGWRRLDEHLLYFITRNSMGVRGSPHAKDDEVLPAGSALWIPAGFSHALDIPPGGKPFSCFYFRFVLRSRAEKAPGGNVHRRTSRGGSSRTNPHPPALINDTPRRFLMQRQAGQMGIWFEVLMEELRRPGPEAAIRTKSLTALILSGMAEERKAPDSQGPTLTREQRELLEDHVRRHVAEPLSARDLASLLKLSPDYFTRLFTRSMGCSPRSYLVRERMQAAAVRLAETGMPVQRVGECVGLEDLAFFSRQFKAAFGVSPSLWRRRHGGR